MKLTGTSTAEKHECYPGRGGVDAAQASSCAATRCMADDGRAMGGRAADPGRSPPFPGVYSSLSMLPSVVFSFFQLLFLLFVAHVNDAFPLEIARLAQITTGNRF